MSSLKTSPSDVCEVDFVSSGSWTLVVVAHVTNENASFTSSLVFTFLVLGVFVLIWGDGEEYLGFSAVCFTKLLLPVGLGGNRKNGGLNSGQSYNFRQRFLFPVLHTVCFISVCL